MTRDNQSNLLSAGLEDVYINIYTFGIMVRVITNGSRDCGSIPGRVIPKNQKMVLDASLLSTHYYKVQIKDKWSKLGK